MSEQAIAFIRNNQAACLAQLKDFLSIPSISTQSEHQADMQKTAAWLTATMEAIGLQHVQIMPTAKHPVVYGDWLNAGPDAPTVLIYGHYDVQPVEPLDLWESPPFEPTVRGDNLFARGATDDKGQLFVHLAAVNALLKTEGALPVNVKFILEGEEEIGSVNLEAFISGHLELLQADCALVSDTPIPSPDQPAIVYGLRGLALFELDVRSAQRDLHSGQYGGVVHNPLVALAHLIAKMHTENGAVTIPGFYDDVVPLDDEEARLLDEQPEAYLAETGARKLWGEAEFSPNARTGARPTFEVHGIVGGYTGEGSKTVIPAAATAKLSMRLVPNQDPDKVAAQFIKYVHQLAPDTVEVAVRRYDWGPAALIDRHDPAVQAAAAAYKKSFGRQPLFVREGGSIPVVTMFQQHLHLPVAMMGFGLTDDNLHAPNEKIHLPNLYRGMEAAIHFLKEYAHRK